MLLLGFLSSISGFFAIIIDPRKPAVYTGYHAMIHYSALSVQCNTVAKRQHGALQRGNQFFMQFF
jgi:hypothetical protein